MSDKSPRYIDHELIDRIEKFIAERPGMTASAFGTQSINDPALVTDLKDGRELRRVTRERILAFMGDETQGGALILQPPISSDDSSTSKSCSLNEGATAAPEAAE